MKNITEMIFNESNTSFNTQEMTALSMFFENLKVNNKKVFEKLISDCNLQDSGMIKYFESAINKICQD